MALQGPLSPGTAVNDASNGGDVAWSNPTNSEISDGIFATATTGNLIPATQYLKTTNFGFTIPTNATIKGIVVEVQAQTSSSLRTRTWTGQIVKGGSISTTSRSGTTNGVTSTLAYDTIGGSTDLWGEAWTPSDINNATFGVVISTSGSGNTTISVDYVRTTVYYTVPSSLLIFC